MQPRLKIYTGEDSETFDAPPAMAIGFGELMLRDFSHDDVMITEDLYEVLTEYSRLRPGA